MDLIAAKKVFEEALQNVALFFWAASMVGLAVVWLREHALEFLEKHLRKFKGLVGLLRLLLLFSAIAYAGTKPDKTYNLPRPEENEESNDSDEVVQNYITETDLTRGYVQTFEGTNEVWDFSPPQGAIVYDKWRRRGANKDSFIVAASDDMPWMFPLGASIFSKITVHSSGVVKPMGCEGEFEVFKGEIGIVPEVNWGKISSRFSLSASLFWHYLTSSNSLQLTWQNVLHNRHAERPISFQAEFFENGNFIHRYDLSSIGSNLTSRVFHRLGINDVPSSDNDGDGMPLVDELFVHRTNPNLADTDGDGISDSEEIASGGDPLAQSVPDSEIFDRLSASQTNEVYSTPNVIAPESVVSWKLFDNFAMSSDNCDTNIVWERTFSINRTSAWQQFFISGSLSSAVPWRLNGLVLEWETNDGITGAVEASPFCDSYRLPLPANAVPHTLVLRLRRTASTTVSASSPIYLVSYAPEIDIGGGALITGKSGAKFYVFTEGSDSEISLKIDHSKRPCMAAITSDEIDMGAISNIGGDFSFNGNMNEGMVSAARPGSYQLPDISIRTQAMRRSASAGATIVVLSPSVRWRCEGHGCAYDGLGYDWSGDVYYEESTYPLDTKCLRKKWHRDYAWGWNHENCELTVSSGLGDKPSYVTTQIDHDKNRGTILIDGVAVWSGEAEHVYDDSGCGGEADEIIDECDTCENDCTNGNCDSYEGASLGSLKFRIPLGAPAKGQISGFVWFLTDGPVFISSSLLQLLSHPSAAIVESTSGGVRRIVCSDSRGRDLRIENIANGVRITIYEAATQKLEHTWEITNEDGDDKRIRLRKISRLGNVMSDETYVYYAGNWIRQDNISGLADELYVENDFADYGDGTKRETRTTFDANGLIVRNVMTEHSRIGECDNAVLRETYREESTGLNWNWTAADYWDDPASARHGRLRLITGNGRAWEYYDYDALGHRVLEVRQRGKAQVPDVFPYVETNALFEVQAVEDAFVTVYGYAPFEGDAGHADDAAKAREETRYVVRNGMATVIGRTWRRYTRHCRNGYEAIKEETWKSSSHDSARDATSNSYSYEIVYAQADEGTPLLMRGAVAESLDENGVLTQNAYSLAGNVLRAETRKFCNGNVYPVYAVTEQDATYGNILRRAEYLTATGALIGNEVSTFDEKNRLRSTVYFDGTFITNAYSCCRLLWRQDREGRKTLRSAKTGTDHLYNAEEDVWIADISTNGGYRVTQHFFDALGRETNTVVCVGMVPGEAVESDFNRAGHIERKTEYPYGGSDYAVSTGERGKVTIRREDIVQNAIETGEAIFTNGVEVVKTKSRTYFGGGSSMRREWESDKWTEERRFTEYAEDGKRLDYVVTESSDCGIITNSVSTYDLLGRLVTQKTALGVTAYSYDDASSRMTGQTFVSGDVTRESSFLYNDFGEQVGVLQDGVTTRADIVYETDSSNIVWRVTAERTFGESTNACAVTRERLTGLSDGCRSCVVKTDLSGAWMRNEKSFDPDSGLETEAAQNSSSAPMVRKSHCGVLLSTETSGSVVSNGYDALAQVTFSMRKIGDGAFVPYQRFGYAPSGDLLVMDTYTNATDVVSEFYAYDMIGNRIATTDALGNTVYRAFDPFGNLLSEWGATYPVRYAYDTQNRRISLSTTRDGDTWDETRWIYDAATGLCMAKVYADGSQITYFYTSDGLLLRETNRDGVWKENVYNTKRQVVGFVSSDGKQDAAIQRDEFGRITCESNAVALAEYSLDEQFGATNEIRNVDGVSVSFIRGFDAEGRLVRFDRVGGECVQYGYAADGMLFAASSSTATAVYSYTEDLLDAGYKIFMQDGLDFERKIYRDIHLRDNILALTNRHGGSVRGTMYSYDALQRPVLRNNDTFGYNSRGEVVFSRGDAKNAEYLYDHIGNLMSDSSVSITNAYTANNLNQYASILRLSATPRAINPQYDLDGNMTQYGDWAYTYDSGCRLTAVSSNDVLIASFAYDTQGRRVEKVTANGTHRYFHDGRMLVYEHITRQDGTVVEIDYVWGKDISGTRDGACGIGGFLYLKRNGVIYIPFYDANGNVLGYSDPQGNMVAEYTYDAFGGLVAKAGSMADEFAFRFSTKYFDSESNIYCYEYRYYKPDLMRWLTEDPIAEEGGLNLYGFCGNNPVCRYEKDGRAYFAYRPLDFDIARLAGILLNKDYEANKKNYVIAHEQLIFEDGGSPVNIGYFNAPMGYNNPRQDEFHFQTQYVPIEGKGTYNDCVMRESVKNVQPRPYNLVTWAGRSTGQYNCQDYADDLRAEYYKLLLDIKIRCKCNLK